VRLLVHRGFGLVSVLLCCIGEDVHRETQGHLELATGGTTPVGEARSAFRSSSCELYACLPGRAISTPFNPAHVHKVAASHCEGLFLPLPPAHAHHPFQFRRSTVRRKRAWFSKVTYESLAIVLVCVRRYFVGEMLPSSLGEMVVVGCSFSRQKIPSQSVG
jgi:hypothetical protein